MSGRLSRRARAGTPLRAIASAAAAATLRVCAAHAVITAPESVGDTASTPSSYIGDAGAAELTDPGADVVLPRINASNDPAITSATVAPSSGALASEPANVALLGLGLIAVGAAMRARRRVG